MKFSFAAVLALAGAVSAGTNGTVYTTEVVTALTTYCPEATVLTHNGVTYTVSEATTLTITNCPCTLTKPVTVSTYNSTTYAKPTGTGSYVPPPPATVTAGANKAVALSGAGLAAALGLAALL